MKSTTNLLKVAQNALLCVLSVCMVISILSIPVKAEVKESEDTEETYQFKEEDIQFEIKENREEHVKHFHMKDGKDVAVTYREAVFSYDGNEYVEIDNQLVKNSSWNNAYWNKYSFMDS